jgi:hypothetical protein
MIRIAISPAAFGAICATLPIGSVAVEAKANERDERLIWLEAAMVDRVGTLCFGRMQCSTALPPTNQIATSGRCSEGDFASGAGRLPGHGG